MSQPAAAQTLDGIRKTIRILLLPLGGDVSDWLDEGMTTLQRARFDFNGCGRNGMLSASSACLSV